MVRAVSPERDERSTRTLDAVLSEITALKRELDALPDPENYERHAHLHRRLDHLIGKYLRLLGP